MLCKCVNLEEKKKYAYWNDFSFRLPKFKIWQIKLVGLPKDARNPCERGEEIQSSVIQQFGSAPLLTLTQLSREAESHRGKIWSPTTGSALNCARRPPTECTLRQKAIANCLSQHPSLHRSSRHCLYSEGYQIWVVGLCIIRPWTRSS